MHMSRLPSHARRASGGRVLLLALLACGALLPALAATARADVQADPVDTPAKGALYRDGSTERYLLGGTWLYQADRANTGIARGLWRGNTPLPGWAAVSV